MSSKLKRSKGCENGNDAQKTGNKTTEVIEISTGSDCSDVEALDSTSVDPKSNHSNRLQLQQQVAPIFLKTKTTACVSAPKTPAELTEGDALFLDLRLRDLRAATFPVKQVFSLLRMKAGLNGHRVGSKDKENTKQDNYEQISSAVVEDTSSSCRVQHSPVSAPEKPHRTNRLSRTQKLRSGKSKDMAETGFQSRSTPAAYQREPFSEDVLWTDKYSPVHSSEVIGNRAAVQQLHSWLKRWKLKTDIEEKIKDKEKLLEEQSNDCWDCGDFVYEVGAGDVTVEPLCNTVLLTGPAGVGKTASVYACATELGFKVFEVNCSSQRNGQEVLAQLKEATQSHLVEAGSDPLKPAFFNSCSKVHRSFKSDSVPVKAPKKVTHSSSKNRPVRNESKRNKKDNPVTLTSYFKAKAKADHLYNSGTSTEKAAKKRTEPAGSTDQKMYPSKKMATCLILFEEVDVIFEDDAGFLTAIKTLMTTTKRPIVLTTTDPLFNKRFNSILDEYAFQTPSMADVCSYLQLVCLAENVELESDDVRALVHLTKGDVRQCLLQLQLWANSGGGRPTGNKRTFNYKGCVTNMLGLLSVTQMDLIHLLQEEPLTGLLQTMVESWRNGVPILYSNLQSLLHVDASEELYSKPVIYTSDCEKPFSSVKHMEINCSLFPNKSAAKIKSRLSRKKNAFSCTTQSPQIGLSQTGTAPKVQCSADEKETSNNLSALSDFFDLMSFMDASMPLSHQLLVPCQLQVALWTRATILDGQLDEMGDKDENQEIILDIQATLEALSFRRCKKPSQGQDASLKSGASASSDTQNLCCITPHLCPQNVHQRFDLNKKVLSTKYFSLIHNHRTVCTEYLPVLRLMCRTHKKQQKQRTEELHWCVNSLKTKLGLARKTVQLLAHEFS